MTSNSISITDSLLNSYRGMLVGLAIGDTLGMSIEFKEVGDFEPLTQPEEGGPFNLPLGYWTDDTSMALCLADSLLEKGGYHSYDVTEKYLAWRDKGYRSSIGMCFDVGNQVSSSLDEYMGEGGALVTSGKERYSAAGNGSIMRLAPVIIATHAAGDTLEHAMELARISARETHYSFEAEEGTALFGALLFNAVAAESKEAIFQFGVYQQSEIFEHIKQQVMQAGERTAQTAYSGGYIVDSLVAAVWAFMNFDTFESGALAVVNLGGDADTNGAIYGQLAGAYYGYEPIPKEWRDILFKHAEIRDIADTLASQKPSSVVITRFEEDDRKYIALPDIQIRQGDLTTFTGDAIVNAANTELFGGSGVCGAIFDKAGYDAMTEACQKRGSCDYGDAVITPGCDLDVKYVIHAVGPIYGQHGGDEPDILKSAYWQSLRLAQDNRVFSIAFPLISTGIYSYPKQEAVQIAIEAVREFYEDYPHTCIESVVFYGFSDSDTQLLHQTLDAATSEIE